MSRKSIIGENGDQKFGVKMNLVTYMRPYINICFLRRASCIHTTMNNKSKGGIHECVYIRTRRHQCILHCKFEHIIKPLVRISSYTQPFGSCNIINNILLCYTQVVCIFAAHSSLDTSRECMASYFKSRKECLLCMYIVSKGLYMYSNRCTSWNYYIV